MKISVYDTKEDLVRKGCSNVKETTHFLSLARSVMEDHRVPSGISNLIYFAKFFSGADEVVTPVVLPPIMKES